MCIINRYCVCERGRRAWCQQHLVRGHQGGKKGFRKRVHVGVRGPCLVRHVRLPASSERKKPLCNEGKSSPPSIKCFCLGAWNLTRKLVRRMPFSLQKYHLFTALAATLRCYWVWLKPDKEPQDSWSPRLYKWSCSRCEWRCWCVLKGRYPCNQWCKNGNESASFGNACRSLSKWNSPNLLVLRVWSAVCSDWENSYFTGQMTSSEGTYRMELREI